MSESGLYPVQTWLWSELDDLGIDGVIYSRHILDLLISSKHTVDFRLAEKEQNIFSKITPGSKRRKHKYSKRSSSFSACEEILWKKENAVACLISAADAKTDSEDTINTIQQVIDELYAKLAGLHLTSDGAKINSDGDYSVVDLNGNKLNESDMNMNADKKRTTRGKENYEDAFPSLDGGGSSPVSTSVADSVWIKSSQKIEFKSGCDSDNVERPISPQRSEIKDPNGAAPVPNPKVVQERAKCTSAPTFSRGVYRSSDDVFHDARGRRRPKQVTIYPPYSRNVARRFPRKRRPNSDAGGGPDNRNNNARPSRRFNRKRLGDKSQTQRVDRNNEFGKISGIPTKLGLKLAEGQTTNEKFVPNQGRKAWKRDANGVKSSASGKQEEKHHSEVKANTHEQRPHLPSWMETTIADIGSSYVWFADDKTPGEPQSSEMISKNEQEQQQRSLQEMAFSSNWFRDPETGLLTFQPSQSSLLSGTSSSVSRTFSSTLEEDDLLQEVMLGDGEPAAPESWMWCPSPSLWEEDQSSPVSRLQSVYKRELLSLGSGQADVEDISGRIWEEYKTIFLDLQEMPGESSSDKGTHSDGEEHGIEKFAGTWAEEKTQTDPNNAGFGFVPDAPDEPIRAGKLDLEDITLSHLAWADKTPSSSYDQTSSTAVMTTGEAPVQTSAYTDDIWKYPATNNNWSAGDDVPPSERETQESRDEVAKLLETGSFGLLCNGYASKKTNWTPAVGKKTAHEIWGGGDMPALKKTGDLADATDEERLMNHLVDAMFSDLSFELLFASQQGEEGTAFLPRKSSPMWWDSIQTGLTSPDDGFRTLSFDLQSFFFQSPIEHLHFLHSDQRQTKWNIDDLFSDQGFAGLSSLAGLDRLFASLAHTDPLYSLDTSRRHALENGGLERRHNKTFLDSVTENDAWKTSLRIGNIWQNISGIRPVNVIYSENKPGPHTDETLIPSSQTHFRPISATRGMEAVETSVPAYSDIDAFVAGGNSEHSDTGQCLCDAREDMQTLEVKTQEVPGHVEIKEEPSFETHFGKPVQDKSMQTAFELALQQDMSSCQQLCARPPKANSR